MSATKYKIRWEGDKDWRAHRTVRLEISVGQEYHEGEKLKTAISWAKKNFDRAVLIVGDSIQGYNLAITTGIDLKQAFDISRKKGDDWLERNRETLQGLEITRWSDWLNHPDYTTNRAKVSLLYAENPEFRAKVGGQIMGVWARRGMNEDCFDRFFKLSEQFILEESAVFACAYNDLKGVSAYPGDFLALWGMFKDKAVDGAPEGFAHANFVRLMFKRRHAEPANTP